MVSIKKAYLFKNLYKKFGGVIKLIYFCFDKQTIFLTHKKHKYEKQKHFARSIDHLG